MPQPMPMTPPPPPPEAAGQMGQKMPFAGVGQLMNQQAANPNAQTSAAFEAVKKVLDNMAKQSPKMAPYCKRAIDILQSGVEQVMGGGAGDSAKPETGGEAPTFPG